MSGVAGRIALIAILVSGGMIMAEEIHAAEAPSYMQAPAEARAWWQEARFGMFIHWGPVSIVGTEIGWSRGAPRPGREGQGEVPVEVYDNLYHMFNPTQYDAREWVRIAKDAGMKYMVLTTKHHDGFCMFDSKLTDYDIMNTPYGKDIVKQYVDACRAEGMPVGFYYSQPDWHHPDYRGENHARYIEYLHGQVRELMTNYGKISILWFDGLGGKSEDWNAPELFKMIRELQPGILINNRAGVPGDYGTPEQRVGGFDLERPWETCMTIGRQWAYKPYEPVKTLEQCVAILAQCAGGDGNLLFNVGPMPSGALDPRHVERLAEMGDWMDANSESIYGTRGGPYQPGPWGASTRKGSTVYLHLLHPSMIGEALELPPLPRRVVSARVLGGDSVSVKQDEKGITLGIGGGALPNVDTVVVLELDGSAMQIAPIASLPPSLAEGGTAMASNIFGGQASEFGPQRAIDGNPATRWATDGGTHRAWLEINLGEEKTIRRAEIHEAFAGRVQKFVLERKVGDEWKSFAEGTKIGERRVLEFPEIKAARVRLHILEATEGPTIWEFRLL